MIQNIIDTYNCSNNEDRIRGKAWYKKAHDCCLDISTKYGYSLEQVIGVMAAISPRNKWKTNICNTFSLVMGHQNKVNPKDIKISTFNKNKEKAWAILEGADPLTILGGNKVRAFYDNILNLEQSNKITIDTHAINIANGTKSNKTLSNRAYQLLSNEYIQAANSIGIHPIYLQAITWIYYRRITY